MFTITIFIITINIIKNNGKDKEGKPIVLLGPFKILMKTLFSFIFPIFFYRRHPQNSTM